MARMNDDLNTVSKSADGRSKDCCVDPAKGYGVVDRAEPGEARRGMSPSVKGFAGMDVYRPFGR